MAEYIERNEVLIRIKPDEYYHSNEVKEILEDTPAADVAPAVHGMWEYIGTDKKGHVYRCSHCAGRIGLDYETAYCPNCGAKMDGGCGDGDGENGGDGMTLYDILRVTRYWQRFCCYVTNAYDQNVPIGFGTRRELLDEEQNDELFDYLMCNVDSITVTKDKALLIRVRDEHFNQRLEEQYECTGGWKVSDPKTRPFKFSNEMEDWEYHG